MANASNIMEAHAHNILYLGRISWYYAESINDYNNYYEAYGARAVVEINK